MGAMTTAAQTLKAELRPIEVDVPGDIESALSAVGSTPMDGLVISDANVFLTNQSVIAAITDKCRVPSIAAPIIASRGPLWSVTGWTSPQCFAAPPFSLTRY